MAQKTRGGSKFTFFAIIVVLAVGLVVVPSNIWDRFGTPVRTDDSSKEVTLVVTFDKRKSKSPVHIAWGIGAAFTDGDETRTSPWKRHLGKVKVGERVTLKAEQPFDESALSGYIEVDGRKEGFDTIRDPSAETFIVCSTVVS